MGNVFAWILMFDYLAALSGSQPRAIAATAILYGLSHGITIAFTPTAAAHLRKSSRRSLVWGVVFAAGAFVALGATMSGTFAAPLPRMGSCIFRDTARHIPRTVLRALSAHPCGDAQR